MKPCFTFPLVLGLLCFCTASDFHCVVGTQTGYPWKRFVANLSSLRTDIIAVEGIQYHLLVRSLVSLSFQPLLIFSCICWPSRHRSVGASMNHNWASSRSHAVQWPTWHHRKVRVSRIFLPGANTFNSINSRDAGCKLGPNWANISDQITSTHNYIHHK